VKDRAFSGKDVAEALALAGATLGLPVGSLRYVVLDPGSPGRVGAKPTPAQIAVMIPEPGRTPAEPADGWEGDEGDAIADLLAIVRILAETAGIDVTAEVKETRESLVVQLSGPDRAFFFGADGRGEVLRAFEHLLQRMFAPELAPLPVRVECEGFRDHRDQALAAEAQALAEEVRRDGQPRTLPALNAYERRIVHMALSGAAGVVTYSVGEGADRRVTVAPAPPGDRGHEP
jgi:spoIIIJ-associated protein